MTKEYQTDDDLSYVTFESPKNATEAPYWEKTGCRNSWDDDITLRKIVFPDGQIEVSASKGKHFNGSALPRKSRAARGESENRESNDSDAGKEAKKRVRQACKMIGADRLITLTYRENVVDRERALKDFDLFRRRLKKCMAFHYVAVMENQTRGAIHFHIAVHGRQCYQLLRSIWQAVVGTDASGQKMAQVNVRNPHKFGFGKDGFHKLAAYIAKYCTKSMECRDLNQKRFFASRGIPKPVVDTWRLAEGASMLQAVEAAFAVAGQGNLDGCVAWCNNALGCVWIATAPGKISRLLAPF